MDAAYFELQWPRENLRVDCLAHEVMNYRYHWHQDEYELSILLHGGQEYCRGTQSYQLRENDVLLIDPGVSHASFAPQANTRALVLHFSSAAFKPFVKKGYTFTFPDCHSTEADRDEEKYKRIRFYAAQIYDATRQAGPYSRLAAKAGLELLLVTLCESFQPREERALPEQSDQQREIFGRLLEYIEENYAHKLSLEDLASFSQYNRTYLSTLFKNAIGVNFYEHLTRVRFQHALLDLATTSKTLTEVALDNGFPDLKTLNTRFRSILHRTPSEYRAQLSPDRVMEGRYMVSKEDPIVRQKIQEYLRLA